MILRRLLEFKEHWSLRLKKKNEEGLTARGGEAGWRAATTARRTAVIQEKGTKGRRRASCRGGGCLFRALNEYSREMLFVADGDEGPEHDDHNRKRNSGRRH